MPVHFIAFWNLENLFAAEGYPQREPWLAQAVAADLSGWTQAMFDAKLGQLASIIRQMNAGPGPDILGVCEVENAFVLQQLTARLNAQIANRAYTVVHADATRDHRGIDTAFVYDGARYTVAPSIAQGPIRFGLPKGNAAQNVNTAGFSDHFPVSVVLQEP